MIDGRTHGQVVVIIPRQCTIVWFYSMHWKIKPDWNPCYKC